VEFIARNGSQSSVYDIKKEYQKADYLSWLEANSCQNVKDFIYDESLGLSMNRTDVAHVLRFDVHRLSGVMSMTKVPDSLALRDILYLQLCIAQQLNTLGYIVNLSEHKQHSDHEFSYIIYLKPSIKLEKIEGKINQLYGNIHTEVKIVNGQLDFFKIMSHRYSDRNYIEGSSFYELIDWIFNNK